MKQIFKYIIVGLIFFILGGLLIFFLDRHTSWFTKNAEVASLKKDIEAKEAEATGKKKQASKGGKKEEKKGKDGAESKKKDTPKKGDDSHKDGGKGKGKEDKKKDDKKKGKEGDDAAEYLRSLWLIKKRKAATVSGPQGGVLYMNGTSPYGPPAAYKDELLRETRTLKISGAPQGATPPPPLDYIPTPKKEVRPPEPKAGPNIFQVQVGEFSSLQKAKAAKDLMIEKGYKTEIYYTGTITKPGAFYLRLPETFFKKQAYQRAQTIAIQEKIVPSIVEKTNDIHHLK